MVGFKGGCYLHPISVGDAGPMDAENSVSWLPLNDAHVQHLKITVKASARDVVPCDCKSLLCTSVGKRFKLKALCQCIEKL